MLDMLAGSPLLTIMIVVALGTLLGIIPFGPVKFGPAGRAVRRAGGRRARSAAGAGPRPGQTLGLALFVYTVGLASGATFFSSIRRQLPLMLGAMVVLGIAAGVIIVVGGALGLTLGAAGRGVRRLADQHADAGRGDGEGRPATNRRSGTH